MDVQTVLQYEIPYLHPLVAHFPPVLLLVAVAAATGYAVHGGPAWRRAALLVLVPAALFSWGAGRTGEALYTSVEGEPRVETFVGAHRTAAAWTLRASVVAALVAAGVSVVARRRWAGARREPAAPRLLVFVPTLLAVLLAIYAGHVGGLMVWGVPR